VLIACVRDRGLLDAFKSQKTITIRITITITITKEEEHWAGIIDLWRKKTPTSTPLVGGNPNPSMFNRQCPYQ
jgi:hypothetical protein